jgi:hypothetical protein
MGAVAAITKPFIQRKVQDHSYTAYTYSTAEVSQATATSMDGYDSRKTKAKRKINDYI